MSSQAALKEVKRLIPPLSKKLHKGQAGRIGVVGGSKDYAGAPYFSCMSAMLLGADLGHIICDPEAGSAIKTYSPDLIVHRVLKEQYDQEELKKTLRGLMERLHAIVVGPGCETARTHLTNFSNFQKVGREEYMQVAAKTAIAIAREMNLFIVIDADGLWLVQNDPEVIKGYRRAVLTPNVMEFKRLCDKLQIDMSGPPEGLASELARALGNVTVCQKGATDIITNGEETLTSDAEGGLKRCGGQGDVLSGTIATFLGWAKNYEEGVRSDSGEPIKVERMPLLAALGGSVVTRTSSKLAFKNAGRAMQTTDLIQVVGKAYTECFGDV